jgi:hypothetical protein
LMGRETDSRMDRKPLPPPRQSTLDKSEFTGRPSASSTMSKSPPVVPRKPLALTSRGSSRSPVSASSHGTYAAPQSHTQTQDLLDDGADEQIKWKALLPQR